MQSTLHRWRAPVRAASLLLLLAGACAPPPAPAPAPGPGTVVEARVRFPSLAGAPAAGGTERRVRVYLPAGYERGTRRYPVVYLLHGGGESSSRWVEGGTNVPRMVDRLLEAGRVHPMIVVMPDARDAIGGSFFTNSPLTGRWEDFLATDLVAHVDSTYRTLRGPEGRALAGYSMGGFGALRVAFTHPGTFGSVYALSPCCMALDADLGPANPAWARLLEMERPEQLAEAREAGLFYAAAASFSPAADAPLRVRLPVLRTPDGVVLDEEVRARWESFSPLGIVRDRPAGARALRAVGMDAGRADEWTHIPATTRVLSEALAAAGVEHRFELHDGDHGSHLAARMEEVMFPFLSAHLAPPR